MNDIDKNKGKVLVIDDDDNINVVLVDKLKASGFDAQGAVDGEDGFKKALEFRPDIILLDVLMPKMNGWQVLEKLKEDEWGKNVKVIMLTVLEDMDNMARALEKGSQAYLLKTDYSLEEIVSYIEKLVRK